MAEYGRLACERKIKAIEVETRMDICKQSTTARHGSYEIFSLQFTNYYNNCDNSFFSVKMLQISEVSKRNDEISAIEMEMNIIEKRRTERRNNFFKKKTS